MLSKKSYFGFPETSEFLRWDWEYMVDYSIGVIIVSIGEGTFKDTCSLVFRQFAAWGIYHDEMINNALEHGRK